MNLLHVITVVFVVLKWLAIAPVATWSWWAVFTPSLIVFAIGIALFLFGFFGIAYVTHRSFRK